MLRLGLLFALTPSIALADDVWTDPFPGIRYLHRSTGEPKEIHALIVDLTRPEISLRATRDGEKGRTTTSFSNLVGAAAAINGDFYNTNGSYDPLGLAIGEGVVWSDDSAGHRFIACSAANLCEIDTTSQARAPDAGWTSAVGGNRLLVDGGAIVQTQADDAACGDFCTVPHPRTAAGLSSDGGTLILVVVEGRQSPILGMSLARLADLMLELGSAVALNLDGGGSSAMVVGGQRVSGRPSNEPSERAVSNHLAVLFDPAAATTGRLVGFVRENDIHDDTAGLPGAAVTLSTGERATTDDRGYYAFDAVPPGDVTVTAELAGFEPASDVKMVVRGVTNWKSIALVRAAPDAGVEPEDAALLDASVEADAGVSNAVDAGDAGSEPPPIAPMADDLDGAGCECVGPDARAGGVILVVAVGLVLRSRRRARP